MDNTRFWETKLLALVWNPPYLAMTDKHSLQLWRDQIQKKFGISNTATISKVHEANAWAQASDGIPLVAGEGAGLYSNLIFRHPMSGEPIKLFTGEVEGLQGIFNKALEKILHNGAADYKNIFLHLWRRLPEELINADKEVHLGKVMCKWDLLPAYALYPSCTIWDYQSTLSAIAGALPNPGLLIFTVASPQAFIAKSRRTQDFWMGSFLRSYTIWEGIKYLANEIGPDCLVFPSLRGQPLVDNWLKKECDLPLPCLIEEQKAIASFTNIFTAIVPAEQGKELAEKVTAKMQESWETISGKAQEKIEKAYAGFYKTSLEANTHWKDIWARQSKNFFDYMGIFWAVSPWDYVPDNTNTVEKIEAVVKRYSTLTNTESEEFYNNWSSFYEYYKEKAPNDIKLALAYPLLSSLTSRVISASKNLRHFQQVGEPGHKCTLCGEREALSIEENSNYGRLRVFWEQLMKINITESGERTKLQGRIRKGERLCAVCITKRLALESFFESELELDHHLFPSTSSMATTEFRKSVLDNLDKGTLKKTMKDFLEAFETLRKGRDIFYYSTIIPKLQRYIGSVLEEDKKPVEFFLHLDGDWLYEESYMSSSVLKEYGEDIPQAELNAVNGALKKFITEAKRHKIKTPSKFYAVMYLDGDHIGDWVSGRNTPKLRELLHPDFNFPGIQQFLDKKVAAGINFQRSLSAAQGNFSLEMAVRIIEQDNSGKLIYAGGDDILAILPVSSIWPVLQSLRSVFSGASTTNDEVDGFLKLDDNRWYLSMGKEATCSASVVIAHHSYPPLAQVLEIGEDVIKRRAKDIEGRDAFAVKLIKHSGESFEVGCKWDYSFTGIKDSAGKSNILNMNMPKFIISLQSLFRQELLSTSLSNDMRREVYWISSEGMEEAQQLEFKRLLERHTTKKLEDMNTIDQNTFAQLAELIGNLQSFYSSKGIKVSTDRIWNQVADLLLMANFLDGEE